MTLSICENKRKNKVLKNPPKHKKLWGILFNRFELKPELFLFEPQSFHCLQRLSFGFRNHFPDKNKRKNTHYAIETIGYSATKFHHCRIGRRNKIVGSPLSCHGYRDRTTPDFIWEDLRNKNPTDRSPRHHK